MVQVVKIAVDCAYADNAKINSSIIECSQPLVCKLRLS